MNLPSFHNSVLLFIFHFFSFFVAVFLDVSTFLDIEQVFRKLLQFAAIPGITTKFSKGPGFAFSVGEEVWSRESHTAHPVGAQKASCDLVPELRDDHLRPLEHERPRLHLSPKQALPAQGELKLEERAMEPTKGFPAAQQRWMFKVRITLPEGNRMFVANWSRKQRASGTENGKTFWSHVENVAKLEFASKNRHWYSRERSGLSKVCNPPKSP